MISNDTLQAAIIEKLQETTALTSLLPEGEAGIKEINWKGVDFQYPCVRVELESQTDVSEFQCPSQIDWSIYVFSEKASSKESNQIAGIVISAIRGLSFERNGVKFSRVRIVESIPAVAENELLWRSQIRCQSIVAQ